MAVDKLSGKGIYLTISGTNIKVTKLSPKVTPKYADTTDTGNYDSATDLIYPSQEQVSAPVEISVEGLYYKTQTPSAIVAKMFTGGGPYVLTCGVASGYPHFGGNYDISDFTINGQYDDTVTWSATLKSNGKVTPNS